MDLGLTFDNGRICVDLGKLLYHVHEAQPDEFDQVQFIEQFAWMPQVRKEVIRILKEEFARPHYNENVHQAREELLTAMKEEAIKYYVDKIASKIEELHTDEIDYMKMYNAARPYLPDDFKMPPHEKLNRDYRAELEKIIADAFKERLPKQGSDEG